MDDSLIMEVWDTFREYIPEKNRDAAANQYVDFLLGKDVSASTLEGFLGYDPHLDEAIQLVLDQDFGADDILDEEDPEEDWD